MQAKPPKKTTKTARTPKDPKIFMKALDESQGYDTSKKEAAFAAAKIPTHAATAETNLLLKDLNRAVDPLKLSNRSGRPV